MWSLILTGINTITILLLTLSYKRMVKFSRKVMRNNLKKENINSKVDVEKCLLD